MLGSEASASFSRGWDSDGTLGLQAIGDRAGSVFVQAPASAKFESMPRSAIEAGVADVVAPVEELPGKIAELLRHTSRVARPERPVSNGENHGELDKIVGVLRLATGHDFSLYKGSTLSRRVERRMGLHKIDKLEHYVRFLRENPKESELLFKDLLIGVTSFFREPAAWKLLRTKLLPELLATCPRNAVLRAWVPACSTGEEAYSLAIVFREAMERCRPRKNVKLQIFATDLDGSAIERARTGRYSRGIAAQVSPARLSRFFIENDSDYRVKEEIRDPVIFAVQNIVQDPPFSKIDLLSCRNLLIYLTRGLQQKLIPLFHYSLNPRGILFLGSAETISTFSKLFTPLDGKMRLYRRLEAAAGAVAVRDYQHGLTRPRRGEAKPPAAEPDANGGRSPSLQALAERTLLTRFAPAAVLTNQEGDMSEEEFKIVHEELESTNEELQSTNEELTTSKEEMQSMNEELQSLNVELQAKVDALSLAGNDMKNLLDSIEIAVLFLDEGLNVRRFTPQATTLFKLIPGDIGRPLADLASDLEYPGLYDDAREVLRTLVSKEKASSSQDGRRFRVRVMPYRTIDNRIDGVVITFTNINPTPPLAVNVSLGGP